MYYMGISRHCLSASRDYVGISRHFLSASRDHLLFILWWLYDDSNLLMFSFLLAKEGVLMFSVRRSKTWITWYTDNIVDAICITGIYAHICVYILIYVHIYVCMHLWNIISVIGITEIMLLTDFIVSRHLYYHVLLLGKYSL